jgi:hypothetical protein
MLEVALITEIARIFMARDEQSKYEEWMDLAILDSSGYKEIQLLISGALEKKEMLPGMKIIEELKNKKENKEA